MRRLIVLLCAVLVTVGMSLPRLLNATPALAVRDCTVSQGDDAVYERTDLYRFSQYMVWDSWDPAVPAHWVDIDLRSYQVSHAGQCWRGYRIGVWTEDGTPMNVTARLRTWVCGTGPGAFQSSEIFYRYNTVNTTGPWGPSTWIQYNVQMPTGEWAAMSFAPYGSVNGTLCGAQADSYQSFAWTSTWHDPSNLLSLPGGCNCWYVNL